GAGGGGEVRAGRRRGAADAFRPRRDRPAPTLGRVTGLRRPSGRRRRDRRTPGGGGRGRRDAPGRALAGVAHGSAATEPPRRRCVRASTPGPRRPSSRGAVRPTAAGEPVVAGRGRRGGAGRGRLPAGAPGARREGPAARARRRQPVGGPTVRAWLR